VEAMNDFQPKFDNALARFVAWFRFLEIMGTTMIVHGVVLFMLDYSTTTYSVFFRFVPQVWWAVAFFASGMVMCVSRFKRKILTPISYATLFMLSFTWCVGTTLGAFRGLLLSPSTPVLWGFLVLVSIYGAVMAEGEDR
jgi:hypothetical protein